MADISHKLNKPNLQLWGSWENIYNMQEIIFFAAIKIMIKNLDVNFKIWQYVVFQNSLRGYTAWKFEEQWSRAVVLKSGCNWNHLGRLKDGDAGLHSRPIMSKKLSVCTVISLTKRSALREWVLLKNSLSTARLKTTCSFVPCLSGLAQSKPLSLPHSRAVSLTHTHI